jgi:hypothetical protein
MVGWALSMVLIDLPFSHWTHVTFKHDARGVGTPSQSAPLHGHSPPARPSQPPPPHGPHATAQDVPPRPPPPPACWQGLGLGINVSHWHERPSRVGDSDSGVPGLGLRPPESARTPSRREASKSHGSHHVSRGPHPVPWSDWSLL